MREPFKAHIFVCTHKRENGESCGALNSQELRDQLKKRCRELGGTVRVNQSGCLDRCSEGIAAVIYPKATWLTHLKSGDTEKVFDIVKECARNP